MRPNMIVRATRKSVVAVPYDELTHWFSKIGNISRSPFNAGAYARVDDVRAVTVLPATEKTMMLVNETLPARPLPGDVVVFIEIAETILSDEGPAEVPPIMGGDRACCVSSTAGRSLLHAGDEWECEKGHRWRVTEPGRAERLP